MADPLVTISILNFERKETLRLALKRAVSQDYENLEVLVVDNASTDGSGRLVQEEFPTVRLHQLDQNMGCAARNVGVANANGEFVITLDNDVLLTDTDAARRVVQIFTEQPSLSCINFKILDATGKLSQHDWCHPRDWRRFSEEEFLTDYVLEGASAFRRKAFVEADGYWAPFFLGHEGLDLGLRLIDSGYDLLYTPRIAVTHLISPEARPSSRIYYTFTRNGIWVALRNHRLFQALGSIAKDVALMGFSSARSRHLGSYFRGIWDGLKKIPEVIANRNPLRKATYKKLRKIRRLQPNIWNKAIRHWQKRPI
jgi:GT2 family glycosyltransferase